MRELGKRLGAVARPLRLAPGEVLFRQGDAARGMFLLEEGCVRMLRHTADGQEVPVHTAKAGETFAEASLFADHYHCDCISLAHSRVVMLPARDVIDLLRRGDDAALMLVARLAEQVRALRTRAELRAIRDVRLRLLNALRLRMDARDGRVRLEGTLKALAAELGMAHETLYRTLAALERDGHIVHQGKAIFVRQRS